MMSKVRRLHPAAILFQFFKLLKGWVIYLLIGLITIKGEGLIYYSLLVLLFIFVLLTISILKWYRFTYQIGEDEFRIEYGIFIRKKRYISKHRIQSIDLSANPIHQIFHLVKVEIETAGSGTDTEASLQAVKLAEGEKIRERFKGSSIQEEQPKQKPASKNITNKDLLLAGATSGSTGVILALLAAVFSEIEQIIPDHFYDQTVAWLIGLSVTYIILLAAAVLIFIWILGIVGTVLKYWNFTITKTENELVITRGLLVKKHATIPLKRIQAVGIKESIIRQPLGYVAVFAEVAGSSLDNGEDFSTLLFPIMKKGEVKRFLQHFLPDYTIPEERLTTIPKRGIKYYLFRGSVLFFILAGGSMFFIPKYSWLFILLLVISVYFGYLRSKDCGFHIKGERVVIQFRVLSKMTVLLYKKRIQSMENKQHFLQRKEQLATVKISIIAREGSANYKLKELDEADTNILSDWYSFQNNR
ncbi:MAG TPA: PH domain-containing protein [Bacillota bacterium]|nr:PH domain-containing protein [Bacillota bacterium]